jgi:transcriptional regulator with XRE-family HTH domain
MGVVDTRDTSRQGATRGAGGTSTRKRLRTPVDTQRAEFLRICRARIKPMELGLPEAQRKRTGGLRREDVASLSGVSVSWYTWLEQGRDMRVSDDVLERLCKTLRLSEDERVYLFALVQHRLPRPFNRDKHEPAPDIVRMIDALNVPAIALSLRWDVLAWNRCNSIIYQDYSAIPLADRNLLTILLARPVHHISPPELEKTARRLVARLRFDYSKYANDPKFEALIRRLDADSPLFRRIWRLPDFNMRAYGVHRFTHPRFGELAFEHSSCVPDGHPDVRVVICTPDNVAARRALAQISVEVADTAR